MSTFKKFEDDKNKLALIQEIIRKYKEIEHDRITIKHIGGHSYLYTWFEDGYLPNGHIHFRWRSRGRLSEEEFKEKILGGLTRETFEYLREAEKLLKDRTEYVEIIKSKWEEEEEGEEKDKNMMRDLRKYIDWRKVDQAYEAALHKVKLNKNTIDSGARGFEKRRQKKIDEARAILDKLG